MWLAFRKRTLARDAFSVVVRLRRIEIDAARLVFDQHAGRLQLRRDPEVLKALNKLCVRLVFCVYAEDAGVFAKDQFLDFLRKFHFSSFHLQLSELFKVLRLKPEERGPFFSEELKALWIGALFSWTRRPRRVTSTTSWATRRS